MESLHSEGDESLSAEFLFLHGEDWSSPFQDLNLFNPELLLSTSDPGEPEKTHPCPLCGKNFSFRSKLSRHLLTHSKTKEFTCLTCNKGFSRPDVLRLHTISAHGTTSRESPSPSLISCPECPTLLKSQKTLERHLRSHESRKGSFPCPFCPKDFRDKRKYQMHALKHRRASPPPKQSSQTCSFKYQMRVLQTEVPPKQSCHTCSFCSRSFSQAGGLTKHINRFHVKGILHACDLCDKSFPTRSQLRVHSRYHAKSRPYNCTLCGSAFVEKGHLDRHVRRVHGEGLRPYVCRLCGKAFYENYELNYHCRQSHNTLQAQ